MVGNPAHSGTVGVPVEQRPAVHRPGPDLAEVGEPEPAVLVEHDVVRSGERHAVTFAVQTPDLAGAEIDAVDPAPAEALRLVPAVGADRDPEVRKLHPREAAVVHDVRRAIRPDGDTVRTSTELGDDALGPVSGDTRQAPTPDLDDEH